MPIIIKGKKGIDYLLVEVIAAATGTIAIGDVVYWSTFPTTVTVGADNKHICGIVPNTVKNLAALARNNSATELTKELFFDAGFFEIAMPIKSMIVSAKRESTKPFVAGEALMAGATGAMEASDDTSPTCGVALYTIDSGTGTFAGAVIMCPPYGLANK